MTKPTWHSGPPPSLGWWPASVGCHPNTYRWWNGEYWSNFAVANDSPKTINFVARMPATNQTSIKWQHRPESWPARSMT